MLDFSTFKTATSSNGAVKEASTGKTRPAFGFKFSKSVKKTKEGTAFDSEVFVISQKAFDMLGLGSLALRHFYDPKQKALVLATVDNEKGLFMKISKKSDDGTKSKRFKSEALLSALCELGVINRGVYGDQILSISQYEPAPNQIQGITVHGVYQITKSVDSEDAEDFNEDGQSPELNAENTQELPTAPSPEVETLEEVPVANGESNPY
jgi:hypothetical protein